MYSGVRVYSPTEWSEGVFTIKTEWSEGVFTRSEGVFTEWVLAGDSNLFMNIIVLH